MKDQIPQLLKEKFKLKIYTRINTLPEEIKQFMLDYAVFYEWHITKLSLIFRLMKQGISELDECEYEGCKNKKKINWNGEITKGCCKNHNTKLTKLKKYGVEHHMHLETYKKYGDDNIFSNKDYIQQRFKEKYGVSNPSNVNEILEKTKKTNLERYGVEWNIVSEKSQEKQKKTNLKRYGVENYASSIEFKERKEEIKKKQKRTSREKYGTDYPMQSDQCKKKAKITFLETYGCEHAMMTIETKEKKNKTMLEKYGVEHYSQDPKNFDCIVRKMYNTKIYKWKTGEISFVQGYEPIVLRELEEKGYKFNDIKTDGADIPSFWYTYKNKKKRYIPDFYIPSEKLIIEVKSDFTLQLDKEINKLKFETVKNAGYNFKLEVR